MEVNAPVTQAVLQEGVKVSQEPPQAASVDLFHPEGEAGACLVIGRDCFRELSRTNDLILCTSISFFKKRKQE